MSKKRKHYLNKQIVANTSFRLLRFLFIASVSYLFLFPLLYLIISSIQTAISVQDPTVVWIPKTFTLENFKQAIKLLNYEKSFPLSLIVSLGSTLATLISCAMAGYGLARFDFPGKRIAFAVVIIMIIVPPQTTTMSTFLNYRFFDPFGLISSFSSITSIDSINILGSPITMILPAAFASGIRAGLSIFIFRQFFLGQPKELEEAAKIDGCGAFGTYYRIMLPLSSPAIITVSVFTFVWYWNDSFFSSLFFGENLRPVAAMLNLLRQTFLSDASNSNFSVYEQKVIIAAAALLSIVPPLILYLIIQRKFSESIERTGIVG